MLNLVDPEFFPAVRLPEQPKPKGEVCLGAAASTESAPSAEKSDEPSRKRRCEDAQSGTAKPATPTPSERVIDGEPFLMYRMRPLSSAGLDRSMCTPCDLAAIAQEALEMPLLADCLQKLRPEVAPSQTTQTQAVDPSTAHSNTTQSDTNPNEYPEIVFLGTGISTGFLVS